MMNKEQLTTRMQGYALTTFGAHFQELGDKERFHVLSKALMESIVPQWRESAAKFKDHKKAYYLSAEFLMGRALSNNLLNLGRMAEIKALLAEFGMDYNRLEEAEEDAGLGNGGLGRLAACFLDSAATLGYALDGYGIRYNYGIFKQHFENGFQMEQGDDWLKMGDPWSIRRGDQTVPVVFADQTVLAVPYDTPVIGYGGKTINTLRLWQAEAVQPFDFAAFNEQHYDVAVKARNSAEDISKVLYPNDSTDKGKILRLKQQYFFVSASLQDLVRRYKADHGTMDAFQGLHAVQLNDTHPAVAVPELIRLLMEEGLSFEAAFGIARETLAYTNHTILAEALEQWPVKLYKRILPKIHEIIVAIDHRLKKELKERGLREVDIKEYEIISHGSIRMAWLSIYGTHSINGVAELHTNILKESELKGWYALYPEKFNNKTNGITQRRWLLESNPELAALITELLGSDAWITDLSRLEGLMAHADDDAVLDRFIAIKKEKKAQLRDYIRTQEGVEVDPDSLFDIQIKRLHEYKRQLLSAFHILHLYYRLKEDKDFDIVPRTFIFGAKAAPGYVRAKAIIKFINDIAELVNGDPDIRGRIKVVFVTNYRVSYAQRLFPAADISEQISMAGKEASGTGNMKFMLNGAPTIGTYDGANVEIVEEAGEENNYIFGLRVEDIEALKGQYDPKKVYTTHRALGRVVDALVDGTFNGDAKEMFKELHDALLKGTSWHEADNYFILKDFDSYAKAHARVDADFREERVFYRKAFINMAKAGKFSSDRTITQYAREIWGVETL